METTLLLIDSFALLVVLLESLRNERLPPGSPQRGWFRMRQEAPKPEQAPQPAGRSRVL